MSIIKKLLLAGSATFLVASCVSGQAPVATIPEDTAITKTKPSFSASQAETVTAVVESIDYQTREVTLIDAMGEPITFVAGDEVRNLKQVSVGDVLVAEYVETVSVQVFAGDGSGPERAEMFASARADEGEMPGGMAMGSVVVTSVVNAINLDNNTFILEGPDGDLQEYVAVNPENLKRAEVGDIVVMTITESVAISVEKAE